MSLESSPEIFYSSVRISRRYLPNRCINSLEVKIAAYETRMLINRCVSNTEVGKLPCMKRGEFWIAALERGDEHFFGEYRLKNLADEKIL